MWHLLVSPKLELVDATADAASGPTRWRVRLVVQNTGWLPSYVTKRALAEQARARRRRGDRAAARARSSRPAALREELGQLEGRAYTPVVPSSWAGWSGDATEDRVKVEWVVRAQAGATVRLTARHERAGVVRVEVALE